MMWKWVFLALGLFLFVNGMYTRTYDFSDPEKYCFQMDLIRFVGCFGSAAVPQVVRWLTILTGGSLIFGCLLWARRRQPEKR